MDGQTSLYARYWIKSWTADHVEILGKTAFAMDGVFPAEGTFTGKISPAGGFIINGRDDWRIGYAQSGTMPFTLTWSKAAAKSDEAQIPRKPDSRISPKSSQLGSNEDQDVDISVVMPEHRSKANHDILLPAGSSEVYATWPDDVRALLRAEYQLSLKDSKLPCNDTLESSKSGLAEGAADLSITNGAFALELARFAIRTGDYARGHCWANRGGKMGSVRAKVLLGVIYMMGWGVPKDPKKAFDMFNGESRTRDFWAAHFLEKCFDEGIGTPEDKKMGAQIAANEMLIQNAAEYEESIGYDNIGRRQRNEISELEANPPKAVVSCKQQTRSQIDGHVPADCTYRVLQDELQQRIDVINEKYADIR